MSARFFCPHCHSSIDPDLMETGFGGAYEYRICPECDEALVVIPFALPELRKGVGKAPERLPAWVTEVCHP